MARIKIGGFAAPGFVHDTAGFDSPPEAFDEVKNVRFNPIGATAFAGHQPVLGSPSVDPLWVKMFPPVTNPLWVYAGLERVFAIDGVHYDITRVSGLYNATAEERWQGEVLNGLAFFNNTIDVPQVWTQFDASERLTDLPYWPSTLRCKFLRPHKYFLIAGYTIEAGNERPYRIRWSHPAIPGTIPASWDIADPTTDAGEFDIAETSDYLVDGLTLGDLFMVYKQNNAHAMQYVGRPNIYRQFRVVEGRGLLWRDCVHAFQGGHFVAGVDDLYVHSGQRGSEQSLVEKRLRKWIFNQIDEDNYFNCYVVSYQRTGESWFCFPEDGETYPTLAVVWNRNTNGIGIREIKSSPFIYPGSTAVVPADDETWEGVAPIVGGTSIAGSGTLSALTPVVAGGSASGFGGTGLLYSPSGVASGAGVRRSSGTSALSSQTPTAAGTGTVTVPIGTPNMEDATAGDTVTAPGTASASYSLNANGSRGVVGSDSTSEPPYWLVPQSGMDQFEVNGVLTSGTTPASGPTLGAGVWHQLGVVDRTWTNTRSALGLRTSTIQVTIREIGTTTPTYVGSVVVYALVESSQ